MSIWNELLKALEELNAYLNTCRSIEIYGARENKILRDDKRRLFDLIDNLVFWLERLEEEYK